MSITTLQTDSNNDIYCPDGKNLSFLTDQAALVQDVRLAGLLVLGEDIFNTLSGVDYFGTIFTAHTDLDGFRASLVAAINKFSDVISIKSLTITQDEETVTWNATILTTFGQTSVSGTTSS